MLQHTESVYKLSKMRDCSGCNGSNHYLIYPVDQFVFLNRANPSIPNLIHISRVHLHLPGILVTAFETISQSPKQSHLRVRNSR